uniref:Redox-regulated ATPase YchF n=1 Tax=Staphylothermus marinus TaxID=2280 RepID=A0A7C4NV45_STAMA
MPPPEKIIGIAGKTNVGKSTLFSALTMIPVHIANHPFTTIEFNVGVGYVRKKCVHNQLNLSGCNPRSGFCKRGYRFIPIKIIDVAGLIPGSSQGRGLGNKFMDDLRQADALIHVVDASGSTDAEGRPVKPGTYDPVEEAQLITREIDEWFVNVVMRIWNNKISRHLSSVTEPLDYIAQNFSGLSISKHHVIEACKRAGLEDKNPKNWNEEDIRKFAVELRRNSKPIIIAANKIDIGIAEENVKRLKEVFGEENIVPISALAELILRKASSSGLIDYLPGDSSFEIKNESLSDEQRRALDIIRDRVLKKYGSTGVQELLNRVVFKILKLVTVYPVEDAKKYTDHHGNVLPDAYLVPIGTTARELAYMIHTELGESFIYAINAKTGERIGEDYVVRDDDVIKVVAARAHR